jgi:spore maturation protein CgeB
MTPRRILIIHKGGRVHTWCEDLRLGFAALGHDAVAVAVRDRTPEERLVERRDGLRMLANPATIRRLADAIRSHRPALVVFLNHLGLPGDAHDALRKAADGAPIVAWLADHAEKIPPDILPNFDSIHAFDSATVPVLEKFYQRTSTRIGFLPLAVNPERFRDCSRPWAERRRGLVFVGNHTADRLALIGELKSTGAQVASYGPRAAAGWRVWRKRRVAPDATARLYGSHQVALNMLQFPNTIHGVNLRAYEIPACGGLGCYPDTPDLTHSFEPDSEILTYSNALSLAEKIALLTPEAADSMFVRARKRILAEHTYQHRARSLIHEI